MSNMVLPAFPGFDISFKRTPEWNNTVRDTGSGREFAASHWVAPRYRYEMKLNLLRSGAEREMQSFVAFFNTHRGSFDSWLFEDPDDRSVVAEPLGVGNGITSQYQLTRAWDQWLDPIYELNGLPRVFVADWAGSSELFSTARTNLLLRSQEFDDAAWGKTAVAVTANAVAAPDGTSTADLLSVTASGAGGRVTQAVSSGVAGAHTFAVHLKAGAVGTARLLIFNQTTSATIASALINVVTGAVTMDTGEAATAEVLAGGWVQARLTCSAASVISGQTLVAYVYPNNYSSNVGDSLYAWGAHLGPGANAGRYILTTTAPVTRTDFTVTRGLVSLAQVPPSGQQLSWSGSYFWRCRFDNDTQDIDRFLNQMYEARKVAFHTVKP